jgi:hypothetical protein
MAGIIILLLSIREGRWKLIAPATPAHGYAWPDAGLASHIRGQVVLADPWTSFTGRSYWGCYGVAYPENHATTIHDSIDRRKRVNQLFFTHFNVDDAKRLMRENNAVYLLINHRLERGETDPAFGLGITVPDLPDWPVIYQSRDALLLAFPQNR